MNKAKNPVIQNDIMRYKKNKLASLLAIAGLVFGCVYFIVLYDYMCTSALEGQIPWDQNDQQL